MQIGSMQEFMGQQQSKVERRAEEMKKIKKGIYQMQAMIDSQSMETLLKECEKNDKKNVETKEDSEKADVKEQESVMTDPQAEMEKMMFRAKFQKW